MKLYIAILLMILIGSCVTPEDDGSEEFINYIEKSGFDYSEVKRKQMDSLMQNICSAKDYEFIDLYPIIDSIANDQNEKLILVDLLKTKGFEFKDWGRGNWQKGPRIVSINLTNEQCECQVDKLYYSTEEHGQYKVTERIKCY